MQYTIRDVPKRLDKALRQKAKAEKKSLNEAMLDAIRQGLGLAGSSAHSHDDLDWFLGTGGLEAEVVKAIEAQDRVRPDNRIWQPARV